MYIYIYIYINIYLAKVFLQFFFKLLIAKKYFYLIKIYKKPTKILVDFNQKLLDKLVENFHKGNFYLVWRLLSSAETFIHYRGFYLVQILLSSGETFIQCRNFYLVWRLLSNEETLSSVETYIQ